ncbi:MAG: ABC transporter permease [Acidilobaceae archaeon]
MDIREDIRALLLVILWDIRKLGRYKFFLAMRFAWFLLQVLVFGLLVAKMVSIRGPLGVIDYYKFYIIGAYVAVLFSMSMLRGHEIVEELEDGLIDYQLSLPIKRRILAIGRALGGGIASFIYSIPMMIVIVLILGVNSISAVLAIALFSLIFASSLVGLAMSIALIIRSSDRLDILMGISDSLLVRLSTVFYPIIALSSIAIYYYIAKINPVSYLTDMIRYIATPEDVSGITVSDPHIMVVFLVGFAIASMLSALLLLDKRIEGGYSR